MDYETTLLCSHSHCCRAAAVAGRLALGRRFHRSPLPDSAAKRQGPKGVQWAGEAGGGRPHPGLLPAGEKSVVERDRAQVGAWQERDRRAAAEVDRSGSQGPGSQLLWLRATGTSQTKGRLIL